MDLTFDQLIDQLHDAKSNPLDTSWQVYRYLKAHFKELGSYQSRMLLTAYLQICPKESGRLHSCMLQVACSMVQEFADFKFDGFLKLWGYPHMLNNDDHQQQMGNDGKRYLSLRQRTDRLLLSYMLHHPKARTSENILLMDRNDYSPIIPLLAVKVYEHEVPPTRPGQSPRKMKSVKLIAPDGEEYIADSHTLPVKPWEIQGRMFDVIIRTSKEGKPRVHEAVVSQQSIADAFPPVVGYVEHYDADHKHYHIFDNLSRHFVAENPMLRPQVGSFVMFSPIIPKVDKFKSAVLHAVCQDNEGAQAFGLLPATITYINKEKGYFRYELQGDVPTTPEGIITKDGFANLSLLSSQDMQLPRQVRLLLFLKRGKDRTKHNYVAKVYE